MASETEPMSLSDQLKLYTRDVHRQVEQHDFARRILKGTITPQEMLAYLTALYHVYDRMENLLDRICGNKNISAMRFSTELYRKDALARDIQYFTRLISKVNGKNKPNWMDTSALKPSPSAQEYVARLEEALSEDPVLLCSHVYTRYLGDLSGGQILSRKITKQFNGQSSTPSIGKGVDFYLFPNVENTIEFKKLFKSNLDMMVLTPSQIEGILNEAELSFELTEKIFDESLLACQS
eukprot:CFRG6644T1